MKGNGAVHTQSPHPGACPYCGSPVNFGVEVARGSICVVVVMRPDGDVVVDKTVDDAMAVAVLMEAAARLAETQSEGG